MIAIENNKHTVIDTGYGMFNYNRYKVFEFCNILKDKEEVKHPTYKKKILLVYGL